MGPGTDVCVNVTKQGQHETKTLFILCFNSHKRDSLYKATAARDSSKDLLLTGPSGAALIKQCLQQDFSWSRRLLLQTLQVQKSEAGFYWPWASHLTSPGCSSLLCIKKGLGQVVSKAPSSSVYDWDASEIWGSTQTGSDTHLWLLSGAVPS